MKTIACIDIGTTKMKAVILGDGGLVMEKYSYSDPRDRYKHILETYTPDDIYVTGSGARLLKGVAGYQPLNELECTAYIVRYLGMEAGLVTNIGTGTSFTLLSEEGYKHLNGTGVGGGAFVGLGERMLGLTEPEAIESMALGGDLGEVNIVIDDIYPDGLSSLAGDVTVANFGKAGGSNQDVALGIHSLITESIVSMVRALLFNSPVRDIVVCGGVTQNHLVKKLFAKYSALFGFRTTYLEVPSYGTALGMLALVQEKYPSPRESTSQQ